jgi:DNA-directed RNA polymerase subunit RPC12/RpoP
VTTFSCPSCGAEIGFRSAIAAYAVCTYCRSLVLRKGASLSDLGKVALLPADMSPFQIGTGGWVDGSAFTLIGRAKYRWKNGTWNEWYCQFDDQRVGWLAEAQGSLMLSFSPAANTEHSDQMTAKYVRSLKLGDNVDLGGEIFSVTDIKSCYCLSVEGEIPAKPDSEREILSIDLIGPKQAFLNLTATGNSRDIYIGCYVDFLNLKFTNLRNLAGWDIATSVAPGKQAVCNG